MCPNRHTKIRELDLAVLVDEHIGALDVAMNHSLLVQVGEAREDLCGVARRQLLGEHSEPR